jgi:hypothetical protein
MSDKLPAYEKKVRIRVGKKLASIQPKLSFFKRIHNFLMQWDQIIRNWQRLHE